MSPTATGLGASDRARSVVFFSRAEIAVRVEKVGSTNETLLLYNFGPNVNVNFFGHHQNIAQWYVIYY